MVNENPNVKKLEFKYEGDFEGLPAVAVLKTQLDYITILSEIIRTVDPMVDVRIKIAGTKEGSLEISHIIELGGVGAMFASENFKTISTAIKVLGDMIKLFGYLRSAGKSVKKEDIQESQAMNGDVNINIVNYGNGPLTIHPDAIKVFKTNTNVSKAFHDASAMLENLPAVQSINISEAEVENPMLTIKKEEFKALAQQNPYISQKNDGAVILEDQILVIKKANLFPPKKSSAKFIWDFIYKTRPIKASVNDATFREGLNNGQQISQGDRLAVSLKAEVQFDFHLQTEVETGVYEIIKVNRVIPRGEK